MIDINMLKEYFAQQVKSTFENPKVSSFTQDWQKGIDLLFELIKLPIEDNTLYDRFLEALEEVLVKKPADYNALVSFVNYLENYLTFIGHLTGKVPKQLTLLPLMKQLGLNDKISDQAPTQLFRVPVGSSVYLKRENINNFRNKPQFLEYIARAYCTRNDVNHSQEKGTLPSWATDQVESMQNRNSVLVVLLYTTLLHYEHLKAVLAEKTFHEQPDIKPYLKQVIKDFKKWEQRFVAIRGVEKIELYAREELEDEDRRIREGSIEILRNEIAEKQLMILGEAGMGKTTTLQYLAFEEAQKCLKNPAQENIPVYLELKLFIADRSLLSEILSKLPFSYDFSEMLLMKGRINLFLDGLNEVGQRNEQTVINAIQKLIESYPETSLLISSRNSRRFMISENQRVPVFVLKKMSETQIREFLQKNTDEKTCHILQTALQENEVVADWLGVPMLLKMMIEVVEVHQHLPENKNELIANFIEKIYQRESERDANFSEITFDVLITHLALKIFEASQANAAIKKSQVLHVLVEKVKSGFPNADLDYFLRVSTGLGILALNGDQYSFTHEEFLDYYAAKGIDDFDF